MWGQELPGTIQGMGSPDDRSDLLGNVALDLGVCSRLAPVPNMRDAAIYLNSVAETSDFALVPHHCRHPLAAVLRFRGKKQAWEWVHVRAREGVRDPE